MFDSPKYGQVKIGLEAACEADSPILGHGVHFLEWKMGENRAGSPVAGR